MGGQIVQSIAAAIWQLVDRQHGVVSRCQLLDLGMSRHAIEHRIASGRLHPVWRGVYAVGRPQLTLEGRWMAAVLACGPTARLCHSSGAALLGIVQPRWGAIEVAVAAHLRRRRPGIVVHRQVLSEADVTEHFGIPVIAVVPTLVDLATQLSRDALEAAISEADKRDLIDPEALRSALDGYPRRPGVAVLRKTLDRRTFRLSDSWLERRFLPIARRAGLSVPETRRFKNSARVDFFWPELGLVVETDGLRYHRTPAQQTKDRLRDQRHMVAGLVPLRFTHEQIRYAPNYVEDTLRAVAARLRRQRLDDSPALAGQIVR
jgi:very-short-patch-repair endonuclease